MTTQRFRNVITSIDELTQLLGSPSESTVKKQLAALDEHMTAFIASSPFLLLGTADAGGCCDVSPRGGLPAAACAGDPHTVFIPDWKGNRLADSLRNIIQTGRAGMLFMAPGVGETLRVNGRACVTRDEDVLALLAERGRQPQLAIAVEVEECFFQCGKALIRSKLWEWSAGQTAPPAFDFASVLIDQIQMKNLDVETLRQQIEESYRRRLY